MRMTAVLSLLISVTWMTFTPSATYARSTNLAPPKLNEEQYALWHQQRMAESTMPQSLHQSLMTRAQAFANRDTPVSVLSIGSGTGEPDIVLASALAQTATIATYDAIEPNSKHIPGLRQSMLQIAALGPKTLISESTIEDFSPSRKFDLIHLIHCVHWFDNPAATLRKLYSQLKPGGQIWIILHSDRGIPQIYKQLNWKGHVGTLTVEQLVKKIDPLAIPYKLHYVDARISAEKILCGDKAGFNILSFLLNGNVHLFSNTIKKNLLKRIEGAAKIDEKGNRYIPEPFGFLVLNK